MQNKSRNISIGFLNNSLDRARAVAYIKSEIPVAFQFRQVFGICINGANTKMVHKAFRLKGETNLNRPISGMVLTEMFLNHLDLTKIHPSLLPILINPEKFKKIVSTMFHIRAPIKPESALNTIPKSMLSYENNTAYMHNLDSYGHQINAFVSELTTAGFPFAGVTTLNQTKIQPEITDVQTAINFCTTSTNFGKIPFLLLDPTYTHPKVKGSWPIIDITYRSDGYLTGIRNGHIPFTLIEKLLNIHIDTSNAKPAAYSQANFYHLIKKDISPDELRTQTLSFIHQVGYPK